MIIYLDSALVGHLAASSSCMTSPDRAQLRLALGFRPTSIVRYYLPGQVFFIMGSLKTKTLWQHI